MYLVTGWGSGLPVQFAKGASFRSAPAARPPPRCPGLLRPPACQCGLALRKRPAPRRSSRWAGYSLVADAQPGERVAGRLVWEWRACWPQGWGWLVKVQGVHFQALVSRSRGSVVAPGLRRRLDFGTAPPGWAHPTGWCQGVPPGTPQ